MNVQNSFDQWSVGPVLSFRGVKPGTPDLWQVSALVGHTGVEPPDLVLDQAPVASPTLLLATQSGLRIWRYTLTVPMGTSERVAHYGPPSQPSLWQFQVPSQAQSPRSAFVSCNGFSDPNSMRKLQHKAGAVWGDMLSSHDAVFRPQGYRLDRDQLWHETNLLSQGHKRFHLLLMGGDQIYFDSIWEDLPELKAWVALDRTSQLSFDVSAELGRSIQAYFEDLYATRWLPKHRAAWDAPYQDGDAAHAMARIPTIMMWDDHDIFDGWGSYTPEMMQCPLFKVLFAAARRAFWVFQLQHKVEDLPDLVHQIDPSQTQDPVYKPIAWPNHLRGDPLALPLIPQQPGFSSVWQIGALTLWVPDLRTERSRQQILGAATWSQTRQALQQRPSGTRHLWMLSSVPVIHPKLGGIEGALNTFGQDHVTDSNADDIRDHWSHDEHAGERKQLLAMLFSVASSQSLRVSIVSGDVHVAALGVASQNRQTSSQSPGLIYQFTASGVVHPSLSGWMESIFLGFLNRASATEEWLDADTSLKMLTFPSHANPIMAQRNWLALEDQGGQLWATWRCENSTPQCSSHVHVVPVVQTT